MICWQLAAKYILLQTVCGQLAVDASPVCNGFHCPGGAVSKLLCTHLTGAGEVLAESWPKSETLANRSAMRSTPWDRLLSAERESGLGVTATSLAAAAVAAGGEGLAGLPDAPSAGLGQATVILVSREATGPALYGGVSSMERDAALLDSSSVWARPAARALLQGGGVAMPKLRLSATLLHPSSSPSLSSSSWARQSMGTTICRTGQVMTDVEPQRAGNIVSLSRCSRLHFTALRMFREGHVNTCVLVESAHLFRRVRHGIVITLNLLALLHALAALLRLAQVLQLQLSFIDAVVGALARVEAAVHTVLAGHSPALPGKCAIV